MDRALRELVWRRAGNRCEYCLLSADFDDLPFQIDHIIAEKHRGATSAENLALACFACNNRKGPNIAGVDPLSGDTIPLFHPRRQVWRDHFRYEGPILVGQTDVGRATIEVLEINLLHRIRHRDDLVEEGAFPPHES